MTDFLEFCFTYFDRSDIIFFVLLLLSILLMMYSVILIHNKLRLVEEEMQNLRKDVSVVSDELELMACATTSRHSDYDAAG